ncbi:MAG: hypothetical protein H6855_07525 [Rhodospirillales bacterium]|nr:hypothetical protein [Rhodospirillales bacterium]MCB9973853.1 hypothetical protein [Rhodospirillales bacterium]
MSALQKYQDVSSDTESLSKIIVDCFLSVHKELDAGYLEQIYEEALCEEFQLRHMYDAQIQSYLKTANLELGFLVNFNVPLIKHGIKRHINKNFVSS